MFGVGHIVNINQQTGAIAGHFVLNAVAKAVKQVRNFITFSSLDGGHAVASEDATVLAGDKIIVESQLFDSPHQSGWTWLFSGNAFSDCRVAMAGNHRLHITNLINTVVDGVPDDQTGSAYVNFDFGNLELRTTEYQVENDGLFRRVASRWDGAENPDCVVYRIAVERAGQLIHDWRFDADAATNVIIDQMGSAITFNLVNVLSEMRVKRRFEAPNKWINVNDSSDILEVVQ